MAVCLSANVAVAAPVPLLPGERSRSVRASGIGGNLTVVAPRRTDKGSVVVRGVTYAKSKVRIAGGVLPAAASANRNGRFSAQVLLRPNQRSKLTVTAYHGRRKFVRKVVVRQRLNRPKGRVSGQLVDIITRQAIGGATVRYGPRTARTDGNGRYTLTGLPDGWVAISTRSSGRLSGVDIARIARGKGRVGRGLMQPLAKPVSVGPQGGSFSGRGWRVQVPAGAVERATNLNLTTLQFTGAKDIFGIPLLDLSPNGLRFARPITVTVDPAASGFDAAKVRVVGVNPDSLTATPLKSRVVGKQVQFKLTTLRGLETRFDLLPPNPYTNQWGGPGKICKPFANDHEALNATSYLRDLLLKYLWARIGNASYELYRQYLDGGVPTTSRASVADSQALDQFRDANDTKAKLEQTLVQLQGVVSSKPPPLSPPETPTTRKLSDYAPIGQKVDISFTDATTNPGIIAGEVGSANLPGHGNIPDERNFSGNLKFIPQADSKGVLTKVDMAGALKLNVLDAVDFCPGNPGSGFVLNATIPLSRLEMTPKPGGGTYGKPILFEANTEMKPVKRDVTAAYNNDIDDDDVPDQQPWTGANFWIDNCPLVANTDQADRNSNRIGDACECPTPNLGKADARAAADQCQQPPGGQPGTGRPDGESRPDPGSSTPPGTGGSYGDPHFVTFDGGSVDFQGAGDYALAESTTDKFAVQGRYVRIPGRSSTMSINRGTAARVGNSVIAFGDNTTSGLLDPQVATLDGKPLALKDGGRTNLPGGAVLTFSHARGAIVRWPDGTELAAGRWIGDNAFITLAPSRFGKMRGLLGNADRNPGNDLTARNGTQVQDPLNLKQLYGSFGASWRAQGKASLFRSTIPASGALPVQPPKVASVADLPADVRAGAEQACRDLGVAPGAALEQCILDICLTGNRSFAGNAAVVANRLRSSVELAALGGRVENTAGIQPGQRTSGTIGKAFATDIYQIDLRAGQNIKVSSGSCPGSSTFSITLVAPSGRAIDRTRGQSCGTMGVTGLRETGRYQLRVFNSGGFTGGYDLRADVDGGPAQPTCQGSKVLPNDDESGPEERLKFPINFRGKQFSSLWVNNNGHVTFDKANGDFTPEPFDKIESPIIAPWFADVDTRATGTQPIRYGEGTFAGRRAFCVDYDRVGYYDQHGDKLNSFQLYIVDRGDVAPGAFDIVFRYKQLQWETGDLSGGKNGLGGTSAGVGYANGTGQPGTFHEVNGSRRPGTFLDTSPTGLAKTSTNSNQPGTHIFPIR